MEGVHVVGAGPGYGSPPVGSRGKAPIQGVQWPKQKMKLAYSFNVFLYKIQDLMSMGAELGQYILQTHNSKNSEDSVGITTLPLSTPVSASSVGLTAPLIKRTMQYFRVSQSSHASIVVHSFYIQSARFQNLKLYHPPARGQLSQMQIMNLCYRRFVFAM